MKKLLLPLTMLVIFILLSCVWVYAQPSSTWKPSGKIRWICPHGPGGGFDRWSRAGARNLEKYVGVPVVVDNVTGTGGVNAMETLWRSKPDGQAVHLCELGSMIVAQHILKPRFKVNDLTFIGTVRRSPFILWAAANSPLNSVKDLIEASKNKPIRGGTTGLSSGLWQSMAIFAKEAGINILPVAGYKSGGDLFIALEAGDFDICFMPTDAALDSLKRGSVKALAAAGSGHDPRLPGVETFVEAGYPKTAMLAGNTMTLVAPPNTPAEVANFLEKAFLKMVTDPEYLKWLKTQGEEKQVPLNAEESKQYAQKKEENAKVFVPVLEKYLKR